MFHNLEFLGSLNYTFTDFKEEKYFSLYLNLQEQTEQ